MEKIVSQLAEAIKKAKHVAVLTGAGISTSAGIPDFRGKNGIYATGAYDAEKTFDLGYFKRDPSHFFRFSKEFLSVRHELRPTPAHEFLARLEENGLLDGIITQNIDGLHTLAGSKNVYEFHGSYSKGHCLDCGEEYGFQWIRDTLLNTGGLRCACGGVVKPDIVFFGEAVKYIEESVRLAKRSDLFIVMGSSLTVYPAASLAGMAGGRLAVVNMGAVAYPREMTDYYIEADIDETAKALRKLLGL